MGGDIERVEEKQINKRALHTSILMVEMLPRL